MKNKPITELIASLSDREREVLYLMAQFFPAPRIAEKLFISVYTVDTHIQRIVAKFGAASRSEVANALSAVELPASAFKNDAQTRACTDCGRDFRVQYGCLNICVECKNARRAKSIEEKREREGMANVVPTYYHWSDTAIECYLSKMDCHNCSIYQFYGLSKNNGCKMPESVKSLVKRRGVPSRSMLRTLVTDRKGNCEMCGDVISAQTHKHCNTCAKTVRYSRREA
jgi:DNA-binding CsgD family transcriptional regulator